MGYKCDVFNCKCENVKLFKLPATKIKKNETHKNKILLKKQREAWIVALKLRKISKKTIHVCDKHFLKGMYQFIGRNQ